MLFKYIAWHYTKNMLIVLLALSGLFAGLDFLMTGTSLPSFNIKVLYLFSRWQEALNMLYPLAIIFGGIWTKIAFVKKNTMSALYALGVSRVEVFKPFLFVALGVYLLFTLLNFSSFATAKDVAESLKHGKYDTTSNEHLFFKYGNSFVYITALYPYENRLEGLTLFRLDQGKVVEVLSAKEAQYNGREWLAHKVVRKIKEPNAQGTMQLTLHNVEELSTLEGYQPKILNSIYEQKELTLYESLRAKELLDTQGVQTDKIRANIYARVVLPLFSIALLMILLFRFPFHARYMNIASTTVKALGGTLFVWGLLFALQRIGSNSVMSPEVAILLPVLLLWLYAIYSLNHAKNRI
ncbi:MAG TPA: YjgP/YjgQ family permease [Campylobacterales bacterium]|nr:YjgP/YjgQ family permease [Campylobacterales bacterium]